MHGQTLHLPECKRKKISMRCGWPATNTLQRRTQQLTGAHLWQDYPSEAPFMCSTLGRLLALFTCSKLWPNVNNTF